MSALPTLLAVSAGPLFLLTAVGAAGLWLIVLGRRGKRLDHHPVCRSCRFDLRASVAPDAAATDITTCPECGKRATPAIGNRRRRPVWVVAGVLIVTAALAGTTMVAATSFTSSIKFFTLLRMETRPWFAGDLAGDAALDELARRWKAGDLSLSQQDLLAADAVTFGPASLPQQDRERASRWDQIAAIALRNGRGTQAQRVALVRSWLTYTLEVRAQVQAGQDVRVGLGRRVSGMACQFNFAIETTAVRLNVAGQSIDLFRAGRSGNCGERGSVASGTKSTTLAAATPPIAGLAPGDHPMSAAFDATLVDKHTGTRLLTWAQQPAATLRLIEQTSSIGWIHDDALADRLLAGLTVMDGAIFLGGRNPNVGLDFDVTAPMAYTVYAENSGQRWRLGTVVHDGEGGGLSTTLSFRDPAASLSAGAMVRLVFEPDPNLALASFTLTEILDRRFAIEDVPLVDGLRAP